jgi:hypothetical protein
MPPFMFSIVNASEMSVDVPTPVPRSSVPRVRTTTESPPRLVSAIQLHTTLFGV